jgi:hypothetical protein
LSSIHDSTWRIPSSGLKHVEQIESEKFVLPYLCIGWRVYKKQLKFITLAPGRQWWRRLWRRRRRSCWSRSWSWRPRRMPLHLQNKRNLHPQDCPEPGTIHRNLIFLWYHPNRKIVFFILKHLHILLKLTQWQCQFSFDNSAAMYIDLKTLHPK